jgi:hypothetical protein
VALCALLLASCAGGDGADPRFAAPADTVRTIFTAYGIEGMSEAAVLARLAEGGRFVLQDPAAFRASFADHRGPQHEGMAGYVFGILAAGKEHLRYRIEGERATVVVGQGDDAPRIVMRRGDNGYKVVLAESVPEAVREQLLSLYGRSRERAARSGLSD